MRQNETKTTGFTLVELMLSMSFVAILLVTISLLIIQISNIYTKGITLRQVNEAGLLISNDFQQSIGSSAIFDPTPMSDSYIVQTNNGETTGGRLCLGQYSYVWNYGKALAAVDTNHTTDGYIRNVYQGASPTTGARISLVKVVDQGKTLCRPPAGVTSPDGNTQFPAVDPSKATELLATGDRQLALQNFQLTGSNHSGLYSIALTIGTNQQAELTDDLGSCKPPAQSQGYENYCAVNKFDIVVKAGSGQGED